MIPVWIVLFFISPLIDPFSKAVEIFLAHDTFSLKLVEPFLYHALGMFLKTFFKNFKSGFTFWAILEILETLVITQSESGHCAKHGQFKGTHSIVFAYG